ncbi:MFS transporter [Streptomyces tritici]|uniref:MFS transporter n=1 Tax=Streptomyces tritici TaxID=2054410 RepID=UPI003AEF1BF4
MTLPTRRPTLADLLISSQFAFNVGFYAVLPHLSAHLSGTLGPAGRLVGLVLGLRTFSQQGMFVIGGALVDGYGPRPLVLTGCLLRIAGFVGLAFAEATWAVIASVLLVGFAAAFFSPAVETEIAREAVRAEHGGGPARTRTLARFSAAGQAGALIGPVIGALLLHGGFTAACLAGAGVFVLVLLGHRRLKPPGRRSATKQARRPFDPRPVLAHRPFLLLAAAYSTYLLAYNQLYLALPSELDRATGSQEALGWLFALSSALVVTCQLPLERLVSKRLTWPGTIRLGLLVLAVSFAATAALLPLGGLWPATVFVVLLILGQMLVVPATRACLTGLVDPDRLGVFTGALSSLSGLLVLLGSIPAGALLGVGGPAPWLALAALPLVGVLLVPNTNRTRGLAVAASSRRSLG